MSELGRWWDKEPEPIKALARKLAVSHGVSVDRMCLPYPPIHVQTVGGEAYQVDAENQRPLWSFYLNAARLALDVAEQHRLEAVLTMQPGEIETFAPPDPAMKWEQEIGLVETPE